MHFLCLANRLDFHKLALAMLSNCRSISTWIFTFGLGEETGWRGFLLPRLQGKYSALTSSLIVGIIWAGWHSPMFLCNENLRSLGPTGAIFWVIGLMFGATFLTWLYNSSRGNILMTALWHGTYNLFTGAAGQAAGLFAGIISMFVMVWVILIVTIFKPRDLSHSEKQTVTRRADRIIKTVRSSTQEESGNALLPLHLR